MGLTKFELDKMFYEPQATPEQKAKIDAVRLAAREFAGVVLDNVPPGWQQENIIGETKRMVTNAAHEIINKG